MTWSELPGTSIPSSVLNESTEEDLTAMRLPFKRETGITTSTTPGADKCLKMSTEYSLVTLKVFMEQAAN